MKLNWDDLPTFVGPRIPANREGYKAREARLLASGMHPSGIAPLLTEREGETCGSCAHLRCHALARNYYKCSLNRRNWTGGRASDVLVRWPACARWEPRKPEQE